MKGNEKQKEKRRKEEMRRIACEIEGDGDCYHCGSRIEWHPPTEGKNEGKDWKKIKKEEKNERREKTCM